MKTKSHPIERVQFTAGACTRLHYLRLARSEEKLREKDLVQRRRELDDALDECGDSKTPERLELSDEMVRTLRQIDFARNRIRSLADKIDETIAQGQQTSLYDEDPLEGVVLGEPTDADLFSQRDHDQDDADDDDDADDTEAPEPAPRGRSRFEPDLSPIVAGGKVVFPGQYQVLTASAAMLRRMREDAPCDVSAEGVLSFDSAEQAREVVRIACAGLRYEAIVKASDGKIEAWQDGSLVLRLRIVEATAPPAGPSRSPAANLPPTPPTPPAAPATETTVEPEWHATPVAAMRLTDRLKQALAKSGFGTAGTLVRHSGLLTSIHGVQAADVPHINDAIASLRNAFAHATGASGAADQPPTTTAGNRRRTKEPK